MKSPRLTPLLEELLSRHEDGDDSGAVATSVENVDFFWSYEPIPRQPLLYNPSIVVLGQGHKVGYFGSQEFRYDASTSLVVGMPIPFECASHCTREEPLLGLRINLDTVKLHRLVADLEASPEFEAPDTVKPQAGVEAVKMHDRLIAATERLMCCMRDPLDSKLLGPGARDEIIYHTLRSDKGQVLYNRTKRDSKYAAVARSLDYIHEHYKEAILVEALAHTAGMSVSAFHRAFKSVTGQSPIQYLKRIRLDKARGLLLHKGVPVNVAAYEVGYESPSQFSREFKRNFDVAPSRIGADA